MREIKKTKNGEYMCSACRAAPKVSIYPRRWKWKTERGFQNHSCYEDEQKAWIERDKKQKERDEQLLEEWKKIAKYKVGENVYYWHYHVTKPTHVQRGTRMVKVRYEEERYYSYSSGVISDLQPNGYVIKYEFIPESHIGTEEEVKAAAEKAKKEYDEHVEFSRFCR